MRGATGRGGCCALMQGQRWPLPRGGRLSRHASRRGGRVHHRTAVVQCAYCGLWHADGTFGSASSGAGTHGGRGLGRHARPTCMQTLSTHLSALRQLRRRNTMQCKLSYTLTLYPATRAALPSAARLLLLTCGHPQRASCRVSATAFEARVAACITAAGCKRYATTVAHHFGWFVSLQRPGWIVITKRADDERRRLVACLGRLRYAMGCSMHLEHV